MPSSNLSIVALPEGGLALAAGREDGFVRVWLSPGSVDEGAIDPG